MARWLVLILICVTIYGCSTISPRQYPASTATSSEQATSALTLPQTSSPVSTETIFPLTNISSLAPGEYLAYDISLSQRDTYLAVMSSSGDFMGYLAKIGRPGGRLSPDLRYLNDFPYIINLVSGEKLLFEELEEYGGISWAPDSKRFVAQCPINYVNGDTGTGLCVFSIEDRSILQITNNPYPKNCLSPSWSPDGRWIAYLGYEAISGSSIYNGLHIIDTYCFSSPADCWQDGAGVDLQRSLTWSPDSRFLAGLYNRYVNGIFIYEIRVYLVENGSIRLTQKYPMGSEIKWISWSPNGKQIAVWTKSGNYLLSINTGELLRFEIPRVGNWFFVP